MPDPTSYDVDPTLGGMLGPPPATATAPDDADLDDTAITPAQPGRDHRADVIAHVLRRVRPLSIDSLAADAIALLVLADLERAGYDVLERNRTALHHAGSRDPVDRLDGPPINTAGRHACAFQHRPHPTSGSLDADVIHARRIVARAARDCCNPTAMTHDVDVEIRHGWVVATAACTRLDADVVPTDPADDEHVRPSPADVDADLAAAGIPPEADR